MSELFDKFCPVNGNVIAETACGHEGDTKKLKKHVFPGKNLLYRGFLNEKKWTKRP